MGARLMLRRLAGSLREQNWTAIVIEFVLLVAGVYLGIQAANWNQAQQDRRQEAELVERLGRDFDAIDVRLTENVSRWQVKTTAALDVLADVEAFKGQGRWPRAKADILASVGGIFDGRIPAPRAATYVELVSAGHLGLLHDPRLRDALLAYDMQVGFAQTAYEVLVQRVQPYMGTLVAHLRLDRVAGADNAKPIAVIMNGSVWNDIDLDQLAADPRLTEALNMYASASRNQLIVARLQQEKARDVLALLPAGAPRVAASPPPSLH